MRAAESSSSGDDGEAAERAKALNIDHSYESSKTAERGGPSDMGATMLNEIETDFKVDAQAQFERVQQTLKSIKEGGKEEQVYRGMALYGAKEKQDSAAGNASNGFVRKGPIRAPQFLRASVRWDFAPDLCKDYKETGFCTFGDSCKFVHDRTDYKHGWELERDFQQGKLKDEDEHKYEISDDEDELPFKCFICRESFTNPIMTKCKHYFCEKCALDHYRKSQKCYVCDKNTYGVFNPAKEIIARTAGENKKKNACDHDHDDDDHSGDDGAAGTAAAAEGDEKHALREDTEIEMLPDEPSPGADDGDEQDSDENNGDDGAPSGDEKDD
uniref:Uncharacterized protein n=1 Tax=Plectus sambesii TaxID=2011161 RepID=A0A914XPI3_9BILA